jgi:hypothetical protein
VREYLEKHPQIGTVFGIILLLVGGFVVVRHLTSSTRTEPTTNFYFTADDGKSKVGMPFGTVPSALVEGKEYVSVFLFSKDGGKSSEIGFLQKYSPEAKKKIEDAIAKGSAFSEATMFVRDTDVLVKKPGDAEWILRSEAKKRGFFASIVGDPVLPDPE